jgi:hypothetical protein
MAKVQDLINVLAAKARFEPVDINEQPKQIRILGRVRTDGPPTAMENWLLMMLAIAKREEQPGTGWKIDISRKYFPRGPKLIFAWRLIIQGENLEEQLKEIIMAAQGAPMSNRPSETMEIALPGVRGDRNAMKNGKGAGLSGRVLAGPAAIQQMRNGGG